MFDFIRVCRNNKYYDIPSSNLEDYNLIILWAKIDCGCNAFKAARLSYHPLISSMLNKYEEVDDKIFKNGSWKIIYFNEGIY